MTTRMRPRSAAVSMAAPSNPAIRKTGAGRPTSGDGRARGLRGNPYASRATTGSATPSATSQNVPRLRGRGRALRAAVGVVIGVNTQDREGPAREFIRRFAQTFPNGMDKTGRVSIDFGVYGVPETFVIEQEGRIVGKHDGAVPEEWLRAHLDRLLPSLRTP